MTPLLGSKLRHGSRCNPISMHSRTLASLVVALLAATLLAGCGGGDAADSSTPVDQLLDETFSGGKTIDSGRLDVSLDVKPDTGQPVALKVAGPFKNQGAGRLPQLDLDASFTGGGQTIEAGVTATADSAFVSYGGEHVRDRRPRLPAVQGRLRGGGEAAVRPAGAVAGVARHRSPPLAHERRERRRGEGRRHRHDQDHGRRRRAQAARRRRRRARARAPARRAGLGAAPRALDRRGEAADRRRGRAARRRDLHRRRRPDPAAPGRRSRPPGARRRGAGARSRSTSASTCSCSTSTRTRTSRRRPAPSRSRSWSPSSKDSVSETSASAGRRGGAGGGGGADQENLERYSQCIQQAAGNSDEVRKCADLLTTP